MKKICALIVFFILAGPAFTWAQESTESLTIPDGSAIIGVKGLVCEFCVKNIEKVFRKQDEVADVSVDLGRAEVTVKFKAGRQISDDRIKELVKDAGYEVDKIVR